MVITSRLGFAPRIPDSCPASVRASAADRRARPGLPHLKARTLGRYGRSQSMGEMEAESWTRGYRSSSFLHLFLYHCQKRPYRPNVLSRPRPLASRPPGRRPRTISDPPERVFGWSGRLPQGQVPRACAWTFGKALLKGAVVVRVAPRIHPSQGRRRQRPLQRVDMDVARQFLRGRRWSPESEEGESFTSSTR